MGTTISPIHSMVLMGHHPACHASLQSFVLEVPTVVKNMKKKNICKLGQGSFTRISEFVPILVYLNRSLLCFGA